MININTSFKRIHSLLILTFLCFLILINKTYSEEKIGSVVALKGEIIAINTDDEKRTLDIYDDIFLFDEIVTDNSSSVTIQYDDNSTVIIKSSSSLTITEFVFSIAKKKFLGIVKKGKVIIESGKIAKAQEGSMEIQLPTMILGIKGTRFNMKINPDGTSEVGLSEDNFGEVGTINISSDGKVQTLYDTDQVISANIETGISERPKTDDEKKELADDSNDLIKASSIDDNLIQEKLEEKLANGTLLDANNDGIIDLSDIDIIKENIKIEKQENINFIVENSTGENTEFLSNVLNISDEASIGESMNQILETYDYLVASVITNLSSEDNTFLTTSNVEANNAIKEKIFTQMLNDSDDENNNIAVIGSIFAKSDAESVGLMMDTIQTVGEANADSTLALEILSSMADSESFYDMDFGDEGDEEYFGDEVQEQFNRMMEQAVFSAVDSEDGAMMLANMMTNGSEESIYMMMDTIGTMGETNADSTLALEVLSSMADSESFYDMDFGDEGQEQYDKMMEQAVFSAADSEDGAMMLANMMTNGSEESIYMMMDTIGTMGETNADSTLALEILSSMADSESFYDMDFGDEGQEQYDKMMEQAVFSAADSEDGAMMLANMMTNGSEESIYMMMDTIGTVGETNPDSTLALEVLSSMADSGESFDDMDFGDAGQEQYDQMMEQAVFSAVDSEDGVMMLANIMTEADADTVGIMFDYISDVSENDEHSTLGVEVLSSVASTAATGDTYFDTEKMDQFYDFIDTTTSTTTAGDDGVADDMYDASGFSIMPPHYHRDTGTLYDNAGFDIYGTQDDAFVADDMYDASGFSMMPPYYHRDTGTFYNNAGFDRDGNSDPGAGGSYDANGFDSTGYHRDTLTLYDNAGFDKYGYHQDTQTLYNAAGLDRYGNSGGAGATYGTVTLGTGTANETVSASDAISILNHSATMSGGGILEYSATGYGGGLLFDTSSGAITAAADTVTAATYTVYITAKDDSAYCVTPYLTICEKSFDSFTIIVSAAAATYGTVTLGTGTANETVSASDAISILNHSATMSGGGILEYSATGYGGGLLFDTSSGAITAAADTVTAATYTVYITAKDDSAYCVTPYLTICEKSFDSFTIIVSAAGATYGTVTLGTGTANETVSASDAISILNHSATMSGGGILEYSATGYGGGLLFDTSSGAITAAADTVTAATYTVYITAKDDSAYCVTPYLTICEKSFDSFTIIVSAAGATYGTVTLGTGTANETVSASDAISILNHSATMSGGGILEYSATGYGGGLLFDTSSGAITAAADTVTAATYTVYITAKDDSAYCVTPYLTICEKSFDSFTIIVSAAAATYGTVTLGTGTANETVSASDAISILNHSATMSGGGILEYSATGYGGGLLFDTSSGAITAAADTVTAATYTVYITAKDDSAYCVTPYLTICEKSFDSFTIIVSAAAATYGTVTLGTGTANETVSASDAISILNHSATMSGGGILEYSATGYGGGLLFDTSSGAITAAADTVTAATYTVYITAKDDSAYCVTPYLTICEKSFDSFTITVNTYNAQGFSTTGPPYYHRNGTIYDDAGYDIDGYNSQGFNAASEYNALYDENVSRV